VPRDQFLFGYNAGGSAFVDSLGNSYQTDTTGIGNAFSTFAPIGETLDDPLYQSESWSSSGLSYEFSLSPGTYVVELNFAEIFFDTPGARQFDILIEGDVVENDLDIVQRVGAENALALEYELPVLDGALSIQLASEIENPKLSALSVWTVLDDGEPPQDTVAPTVSLDVIGAADTDQPTTVVVSYADNVLLDETSIALSDLEISGPGTYSIVSQDLTFGVDGQTPQATYEIVQDGGWTSDTVSFSVAPDAVLDTSGNGNAATASSFSYSTPFSDILPVDTYTGLEVGSASVTVTGLDGIQTSTFSTDAFAVSNVGDKRIAAIYFDISEAVLDDAVFDPVGLAGDSVARGLTFGSTGSTGADEFTGGQVLEPFFGLGGSSGYEGLLLTFDPTASNGFEPGESISFGVDIDPNSIVGIPQNPIDISGNDPRFNTWDIGGVSGAELIGSSVEVLFTDGTVAQTQLISDGSQGGARALADEASPNSTASLTVNGLSAGQSGDRLSENAISIQGSSGQVAQVVAITGFSQPFDYTAPDGELISVLDRLQAANADFLANNAFEVQVAEIALTGDVQDISSAFDFTPSGTDPDLDESELPIAFVSTIIDSNGDPVGPVTAPIYLNAVAAPDLSGPQVSIEVDPASSALHPIEVNVTYTDADGIDVSTLDAGDLGLSALGGATFETLNYRVEVAPDLQTATASYLIAPSDRDWTGKALDLSVSNNAVQDVPGSGSASAQANYAFTATQGPQVDSLADMTQLALQGVSLVNPTSIDVAADGRLYISQQNGEIVALTVDRNVSTDTNGVTTETWTVTDREDISLVRDLPNHSDGGVYQPGVTDRQITGLVTATDENGNIVLYVGSSDPRIGGGGGGDDVDLDTNSGILSRLTQQADGTWEKLDLVRGLPRSEENHSINGMELITNADGDESLLLTVGGHTNAGAQSNNFAYTPEYYYSAAVVEIDLPQLNALEAAGEILSYTPPGSSQSHQYLYDLPTLDDITRSNTSSGEDFAEDGSFTADVFGGNNGLNQAIYDPLGIVEVVYSGFRNHYDITVTPAGEVYTVDNGANTGWGGSIVNASSVELFDLDGDGIADNGPGLNLPNEQGQAQADSLLRLDGNVWQTDTEMYYGGHPNLYRAYGQDAGMFLFASASNQWGVSPGTPLGFSNGELSPASAPVDLIPFIPNADQISGVDTLGQSFTDPRQALQLGTGSRQEGLTDTPNGALYTFFSSTNGLDVFDAGGNLQGDLVTVSFNGQIYALKVGPDGDVIGVESRALTSSPLDLVTQGNDDPYPGVIFVAAYGADQIVILSPDESVGVTPNPNDRDEDGIDDTIDAFAADPDNGLLDPINPDETLLWTFVNGETYPNDRDSIFDGTAGLFNGGGIGFTGIMTNRAGLPESRFVQDNIIFGGAPGVLQVKDVDPGDTTDNTQRNAFQIGTTVGEGTEAFTVSSLIDNYINNFSQPLGNEKLSQGIFLGSGDQNNYVAVSMVRLEDGRTGFEVISQFAFDFVGATAPDIAFYEVPELPDAGLLDTVRLFLDVNVASASVTPRWEYDLEGQVFSGTGSAVALQGDALLALNGELTLPNDVGGQVETGLAVGILSSRSSDVVTGGASDVIAAISSGGDESFTATIDGTVVTFVPDTTATNVLIEGATSTYGTSESTDFANTDLDELHTEERYASSGSTWGYNIDTGNGTFLVDLYFADIFPGTFATGARVFDVLVEDFNVADSLDIFSQVGGNAEYVISVETTVSDGILDIDFESLANNAKLSGLVVRDTAASAETFAADWDYIRIDGSGLPPVDDTAPMVTISTDGGVVADDPLNVTVTYSDDVALDAATIELADLTIAGTGTYSVIQETLDIDPGGSTATATYSIIQDLGWTSDPVTFSVAGGAISDTSGNINEAVQAGFTYDSSPSDVTAPTASISLTGASGVLEPLTVTVDYADETDLDLSTVDLTDLSIIGAGTYDILSETLTPGTEGLTATATYEVQQTGGWTEDTVQFALEAGAFADIAGNANAAVDADFLFTPEPVDGTPPEVAIALAGGDLVDTPLTVTVTYSDDVALDPTSIGLDDLVVSGSGTFSIAEQSFALSSDGSSATAVYTVERDGGWTPDPVSVAVSAGAISDASGNTNNAASEEFVFQPPAEDELVLAINAGGPDYLSTDGTLFVADTYLPGNGFSVFDPIAGTDDDTLYQSEIWGFGDFTYDVPLANGTYRVDLHFAEIYSPHTQTGDRVFDLFMEGALVLDDFDPIAAAGAPFAAHVHSEMVTVSDGSLTITTSGVVENPKLSGFSVWSDADSIA
jgi:hypothetical protein